MAKTRLVTRAEADALYGYEYFYHNLAGVAGGATPDAVSMSGHTLTWTQAPIGSLQFGEFSPNRGAFFTPPGPTGSASYMCGSLASAPLWGRMKFAFLQGSTNGGTACLAVPSKPEIGPPITMRLHYRTTRFGWALSVWDGGEVVLREMNYGTPLAGTGVTYEMSFLFGKSQPNSAIDTCWIRTPEGYVYKKVDSRFGTLGGPYVFGESYAAGPNDDIVGVTSLEAGSRIPVGLMS